MRRFLLLLFSLMTGCEAVKECPRGWVEFICKYPDPQKSYQKIVVVNEEGIRFVSSTQRDVWEIETSVSLYHDTKNKNLRVVIKQLKNKDSGGYKCIFIPKTGKEKLTLVFAENGCQGDFFQTAYTSAKTTITCDYPGNRYKSNAKFFCKENNFTCEDIFSTKSSPKLSGRFSLTETNSGFSVSISNVSSHDAGVYLCGEQRGNHRAGLQKIQLMVEKISYFTRSPNIGENFTYWCGYKKVTPMKKFICKGEDPSVCTPLVSTTMRDMNNGKFFLRDNREKTNLTITVRNVTTDDTGTYWCGAESTDSGLSDTFFHRFLMTVVQTTPTPTPTPTSTFPVSTTSTSAKSDGVPPLFINVIIGVAVLLLLLFVVILILIERFLHSKTTRNGAAAPTIREDYVYEEIQERVQKPGSGNAATTIYDTINFSSNPSASPYYSTINFLNSPDKADGEALIIKPGSACEYSTVKFVQSPTNSPVNEPSTASLDPLYATVNKPKKQKGNISPVGNK